MGSSGSNGVVERAVQAVEGQIRVMKLALEDRIGKEVKADSCIVTFMAEYAAYMMNRLEVGKDGKTPYERVKGKAATLLGVEFGEKFSDYVGARTRWRGSSTCRGTATRTSRTPTATFPRTRPWRQSRWASRRPQDPRSL